MIELRTLSPVRDRDTIDRLLSAGDIRLPEGLDALYGAFDGDVPVGMAGRRGNVIQCAAVAPEARGSGVLNTLVSQLMRDVREAGSDGAFVFTKPASAKMFSSLGFTELARAEQAALLYSRRDGVLRWANALPQVSARPVGAIVMNANPFTRGHRYLVEQAAGLCGSLYVFVVEHDASRVPFCDRIRLVREGTADLGNVTVVAGGPFIISPATFPTYFLKEVSEASAVHAALDAALFAWHIAPALRITRRFVGSEPLDPATQQYNEALLRILPPTGVELTVLPRLEIDGAPVSASRVRALIDAGRVAEAEALVPPPTYRYLLETFPHNLQEEHPA